MCCWKANIFLSFQDQSCSCFQSIFQMIGWIVSSTPNSCQRWLVPLIALLGLLWQLSSNVCCWRSCPWRFGGTFDTYVLTAHLSMWYVGLYKSNRLAFSGWDGLILDKFQRSFGTFRDEDVKFFSRLCLMHSGCGWTVVIFTEWA